jgi:hypothetical protein
MHRHQNCAFILNIDKVMAVFTYLLLRPLAISAAILAAICNFLTTSEVVNVLYCFIYFTIVENIYVDNKNITLSS